jgi:hypothetical protein
LANSHIALVEEDNRHPACIENATASSSSFPKELLQTLVSLFGGPASSHGEARGFASSPRGGFAFFAALLEEDAPTLL